MYITYEAAQYSDLGGKFSKYAKRVKPPKTIPNDLPKPDFMPTKLVRISDMKVIDGSQVNQGYCALSYSWNQSGDILIDETTGKYKRIDEGRHEIISYDDILPDMIIPCYRIPNAKLFKIYRVFNIMENNNYYFTKTVQYVKFEGIIQQICQQFNIKYIWYDQLCINQDNKEEKQQEICNMHRIYENAYCTVALVPEYSYKEYLDKSEQQYFKRLWTLEEALKSKRLLFVGSNEHQYLRDTIQAPNNALNLLAKSFLGLNVSEILFHAHQRTSTKDHDRVFALIQLFPGFMNEIKIDYNQPFEDSMIQFYGLLARKDISILYFTSIGKSYKSTVKKYKFLPSWTGVNGAHITYGISTPFQNYDIIGKTMYVTTTYVTNNQSMDDDNLTIREEDIPTINEYINDGDNEDDYSLCILVQLSETNEMKRIALDIGFYRHFARKSLCDKLSKKLQQLSRFMDVKKENLRWCHKKSDDFRMAPSIYFGALTDSLDDTSTQYVILSEILFKSVMYRYNPVIKKEQGEEYYNAIGCCKIESNEVFFSDCNLPKQTFLIQ